MIINAENRVLGRLASEVAQKAREGEEIDIVNAEKTVISGDKESTLKEYKKKHDRGVRHRGPHFPKSPERILKRSITGMMPDSPDGREAQQRVKAYIGVPIDMDDYEESEAKTGDDLKNQNYTTLEEVSKFIGWEPRGEY